MTSKQKTTYTILLYHISGILSIDFKNNFGISIPKICFKEYEKAAMLPPLSFVLTGTSLLEFFDKKFYL